MGMCVGWRELNEFCKPLERSGMKYLKTSHLRLQSITSTELGGLAQYSLKKFLFVRWNWTALTNGSSLIKKDIFFSGFFKSCVSHNRQQIIEYCLLSKHSQALEPCLWDEKPVDLGGFGSLGVWSYWFCKKKKKKRKLTKNDWSGRLCRWLQPHSSGYFITSMAIWLLTSKLWGPYFVALPNPNHVLPTIL